MSFQFKSRGRMAVGFTTTCAINAYHHSSCEFQPRSWQGVLDKLCERVVLNTINQSIPS